MIKIMKWLKPIVKKSEVNNGTDSQRHQSIMNELTRLNMDLVKNSIRKKNERTV